MMMVVLMAAMLQAGSPAASFRSIERGAQTFVDAPKQVTARTPDEWAAVWKLHAPGRPAPQVDFSREMVVGVFLGTRNTAGYSVEIVGAENQQGSLVVRYRESGPPRDAITAQVITSPYHLVAVPRQDGAVRFERVQQ